MCMLGTPLILRSVADVGAAIASGTAATWDGSRRFLIWLDGLLTLLNGLEFTRRVVENLASHLVAH